MKLTCSRGSQTKPKGGNSPRRRGGAEKSTVDVCPSTGGQPELRSHLSVIPRAACSRPSSGLAWNSARGIGSRCTLGRSRFLSLRLRNDTFHPHRGVSRQYRFQAKRTRPADRLPILITKWQIPVLITKWQIPADVSSCLRGEFSFWFWFANSHLPITHFASGLIISLSMSGLVSSRTK